MLHDKPVILCVDDEENPLILRRLVLERAGYDVVTACSATQALGVLGTRHVDLVLSDHLMAGSTGTDSHGKSNPCGPRSPSSCFQG